MRQKRYMQYSSDGRFWGFSSTGPFNADKIAKSLGVKEGGFIYYREHEGDLIRRLRYGVKYGR